MIFQIVLKHLDAAPGQPSEEAIEAKFVIGADGMYEIYTRSDSVDSVGTLGAHSWIRRTLGIPMEGENTGGYPRPLYNH